QRLDGRCAGQLLDGRWAGERLDGQGAGQRLDGQGAGQRIEHAELVASRESSVGEERPRLHRLPEHIHGYVNIPRLATPRGEMPERRRRRGGSQELRPVRQGRFVGWPNYSILVNPGEPW